MNKITLRVNNVTLPIISLNLDQEIFADLVKRNKLERAKQFAQKANMTDDEKMKAIYFYR